MGSSTFPYSETKKKDKFNMALSSNTAKFLIRESKHIAPFLVGFGVITAVFFSVPTPPEDRHLSHYARQHDGFWSSKAQAEIFDHHGHGDHGAHGAVHAGAHGHGNQRIAEVTDYVAK